MPKRQRVCLDCDAALVNPQALRCRSCAARQRHRTRPPATRWTPATGARARAAAQRKHALDREAHADVDRLRAEIERLKSGPVMPDLA